MDPNTLKLFYEPKDRLRLTVGEEKSYHTVKPAWAAPLSHPGKYLALLDGKGSEIVTLPDPNALPPEFAGGGAGGAAPPLPDGDGDGDHARQAGIRGDLLERGDRPRAPRTSSRRTCRRTRSGSPTRTSCCWTWTGTGSRFWTPRPWTRTCGGSWRRSCRRSYPVSPEARHPKHWRPGGSLGGKGTADLKPFAALPPPPRGRAGGLPDPSLRGTLRGASAWGGEPQASRGRTP